MAKQETLTIILEAAPLQDLTTGDQVLCMWRIRGSFMASSLPFGNLRVIAFRKPARKGVLALRFLSMWDSGSGEHCLCLALCGQKDDESKGLPLEGTSSGVRGDESQAGDRPRSSESGSEGGERASNNGQVTL